MTIDIGCPLCHLPDAVQRVPAVVMEGRSTSTASGVYSGFGVTSAGLVPVVGVDTVDHVHTSALARDLALAPPLQPVVGLRVVGLLLLFFPLMTLPGALGVLRDQTFQGPALLAVAGSAVALLGALMFTLMMAIPSIVALAVVRGRTRRNERITRGRGNALAVWQAGFYCHRCGVGYWPQSPAPGIPAQVGLHPRQFRGLVWNAGGYANV